MTNPETKRKDPLVALERERALSSGGFAQIVLGEEGITFDSLTDGLAQMHGLSAEELKSDPSLLTRMYGRVAFQDLFQHPHSIIERTLGYCHPDGSKKWSRWHVVPRRIDKATAWDAFVLDSTEDTLRETRREARESMLRTIIDSEPTCLKVLKRDGTLIEMNPAGLAMIGATSLDDVRGVCLFPMLAPESREAFLNAHFRACDGQQTAVEFEITLPTGERKRLQSIMAPYVLPGTGEKASLGLSQDVTERARILRQLEESRGQASTLIDSLKVILWEGDIQTDKVLYISPQVERLLGYSTEQIVGSSFWRTIVHPDDLHLVETITDSEQASSSFVREFRLFAANGGLVWIRAVVSIVNDEDGKPKLLRGVWVDISDQKSTETALRESEERLRLVVETAFEYISEVDEHGIFRYVSRADPPYTPDSLIGRISLFDVAHPKDHAQIRRALDDVFVRGKGSVTTQVYVPANGRHYSNRFALMNSSGVGARALMVTRDVTEALKMEEQIRQKQKLEAIGTLAGGVAHDFNNLLAAIEGNCTLGLEETKAGTPVYESLKQIEVATKRATNLVQQILIFSRGQNSVKTATRIGDILNEDVRLLRAAIPSNVEIRTTVADDLPEILANAGEMNQVIMNLGTNAAQAIVHERGLIEIGLKRVVLDEPMKALPNSLPSGEYVVLSVMDNGSGMSEETVSRVFEPFFSTKGPGEGTGLGLSVVHGIVASHRGAISIDTRLGEGTTVSVWLPTLGESKAKRSEPPGSARTGSGQVLIVDDEEALVFLTKRNLSKLGYKVAGFTNPNEAIEAFAKDPHAFDLVITDLSMPAMTGFELTDAIKKVRPDIPIVLMTGFAKGDTSAIAREKGITEVILKPSTVEEIGQAVERWLEKPV